MLSGSMASDDRKVFPTDRRVNDRTDRWRLDLELNAISFDLFEKGDLRFLIDHELKRLGPFELQGLAYRSLDPKSGELRMALLNLFGNAVQSRTDFFALLRRDDHDDTDAHFLRLGWELAQNHCLCCATNRKQTASEQRDSRRDSPLHASPG